MACLRNGMLAWWHACMIFKNDKQPKISAKIRKNQNGDRPTDQPTEWLIGRVARDKKKRVRTVAQCSHYHNLKELRHSCTRTTKNTPTHPRRHKHRHTNTPKHKHTPTDTRRVPHTSKVAHAENSIGAYLSLKRMHYATFWRDRAPVGHCLSPRWDQFAQNRKFSAIPGGEKGIGSETATVET